MGNYYLEDALKTIEKVRSVAERLEIEPKTKALVFYLIAMTGISAATAANAVQGVSTTIGRGGHMDKPFLYINPLEEYKDKAHELDPTRSYEKLL